MLTILDNDAAIEVSRGTGALALTEGGNATHTVTLTGQPSGAVVVDVTSDDAGAVAPAALTVMGSAVSDADSTNETVTVPHAVNDGASADGFNPAPDVTFTVNVTDNTPNRNRFEPGLGGLRSVAPPRNSSAWWGPNRSLPAPPATSGFLLSTAFMSVLGRVCRKPPAPP